jgi:hypothetical protein
MQSAGNESVPRETYGARSSRVQIAARVLGRVHCCHFSFRRVERAIATISILSWLRFLGFCFFFSLLATIRFSRSLSGRCLFGLLGFRQHAVPKWPAFLQKSQSTDDFYCPSRLRRQRAQGSQSFCYQLLHQKKNHP